MKNRLKTLLTLTLSILVCLTFFVSCNRNKGNNEDTRVKITESEIKSALADSDGTLTIEGDSEDVTSFKYVVTGINASKLTDKSYTRKAVNTLLTNPSNITFGEYKVCKAFSATVSIVSLFVNDDGSMDSSAFDEEILNIVCDGNTNTYGEWKVSATIDNDADSITIVAACE